MLRRSLFILERLTGKVKFRSLGRHPWGFLDDQNNVQQFWHSTEITASVKPFKTLKVGETVEFEVIERNGRKMAGKLTAPGGGPIEGADEYKRIYKKDYIRREVKSGTGADQGGQGVAQGGRLTGTVKFKSVGKRPWGLLIDQNKVKHLWLFNDITASVKPIKTLKVGETVEFEIIEIDGKKRAGKVTAPGGGPVEGLDPKMLRKQFFVTKRNITDQLLADYRAAAKSGEEVAKDVRAAMASATERLEKRTAGYKAHPLPETATPEQHQNRAAREAEVAGLSKALEETTKKVAAAGNDLERTFEAGKEVLGDFLYVKDVIEKSRRRGPRSGPEGRGERAQAVSQVEGPRKARGALPAQQQLALSRPRRGNTVPSYNDDALLFGLS